MSDNAIVEYQSQILEQNAPLRDRFHQLVAATPTADGDAWDSILGPLFDAEEIEDLDRPWRSESLGKYIGRTFRFESIKMLPSDFTEGLGLYLVVEGVDTETGEKAVATTGSVSVMVQLMIANMRRWLPRDLVVCEAERPTKNGYRPLHLEVPRGVR